MMILANWTFQLGLPRVGILSVTSMAWTTFMNPLAGILLIPPYRKALYSKLTNERRWCFSRSSETATTRVTAS
uniref:Uncharacterized protein n=1 Tax=Acrobeloides nanus TaxID=290746 RepID=A0A914EGT0_9BILA